MVNRITIVASVLGATQMSAVLGSIILAVIIGIYDQHSVIETLMVLIAIALVAFVVVNCVGIFLALPLRLLFPKKISLLKAVSISTLAGAIIYPAFDLVTTSLWYLANVGEVALHDLQVRDSIQAFSFIGSIYGFCFGAFYHALESCSLTDRTTLCIEED